MIMSASPSSRTPLQQLQAHSLWLSLACLNLSYAPLLGILFLSRPQPTPGYATDRYILAAGPAVWFLSLFMLVVVAVRHARLRSRAREAAAEATPRLRRSFRDYRGLASGNFFGGPALIVMAGAAFPCLHMDAIAAGLLMPVLLPGSLTWLIAAKRDEALLKKDR